MDELQGVGCINWIIYLVGLFFANAGLSEFFATICLYMMKGHTMTLNTKHFSWADLRVTHPLISLHVNYHVTFPSLRWCMDDQSDSIRLRFHQALYSMLIEINNL